MLNLGSNTLASAQKLFMMWKNVSNLNSAVMAEKNYGKLLMVNN